MNRPDIARILETMRLTLHTDYALRVLIHVGLHEGDLVTVNEIAECQGISKNHLTKVVHHLGRAGYLETVRGKHGGVRLLKRPEQIRLGALIRSTEEDFALVRCLREEEETDPCRMGGRCLAYQALAAGLTAFFAELDRYTLADVLERQREAAQ